MPTILLIEDENAVADILHEELSSHGFDVCRACNGQEGLEKIRETKPHLVILEILLPKIDGFQVLKEIKGDEDLRDVPVIILSNLTHEEDVTRGLALGAEDFLVDKSEAGLTELIRCVKRVCA